MAAVEPLGSADPSDPVQWLVVRGPLREADLVALLDGTADAEVLRSTGTVEHSRMVFQISEGV